MVGEEHIAQPAPLLGPGHRRLREIESADEDLIESCNRNGEACKLEAPQIEIAAEDAPLCAREELGGEPHVLLPRSGVEISDDEMLWRAGDLQ